MIADFISSYSTLPCIIQKEIDNHRECACIGGVIFCDDYTRPIENTSPCMLYASEEMVPDDMIASNHNEEGINGE